MRNRKKILTGALILFFLLSGCSNRSETAPEHQAVIQVDDLVLTLAEFNEFFEPIRMSYAKDQTNPGAGMYEARLRFLLQLLEEMIILRRAEELRLHISPQELEEAVHNIQRDYSEGIFQAMFIKQAISFETWKARLERQLLVEKAIRKGLLEKTSVTPEEIKDYYDKHHKEWTHGEQVRAYHILLPSKKLANLVLGRLKKGEDLATLARVYSIAPESERGGDMGYVVRGQLPKYLEKPLFSLRQGTVSPVIKTAYGYHIFKVVEKIQAGEPKINDWFEKIKERIQKKKLEVAYGPWLANLRSRYKIRVNKEII